MRKIVSSGYALPFRQAVIVNGWRVDVEWVKKWLKSGEITNAIGCQEAANFAFALTEDERLKTENRQELWLDERAPCQVVSIVFDFKPEKEYSKEEIQQLYREKKVGFVYFVVQKPRAMPRFRFPPIYEKALQTLDMLMGKPAG